jgi:alkanesulfonate monooxygenase SsuD/methylene tetrahydromethanopterin reductase-like flavin-dependent oxidoreductase (luciferase family)
MKRVETDDGQEQVIPDASIREVHEDAKQILRDQVEHAVKAEEHGFDRISFTEHHFQIVGAEFSPNPLMTSLSVAERTEEIRVCQWANIITWHDPVRFAEQAAQLDVISDGRAEIGIGRGYQPRENEVLGDQYWSGTIQDQEKNRQVFFEKFDILKKAWTEDMFSYNGHYHHIPPKHTKWHHLQEKEYLDDDVSEYEVEDMLEWNEGDLYSQGLWNPVVSGGTLLKELSVFPQPLQQPYPPLWQPVTSYRSVRWCARNGVNGVSFGDPKVGNKMEVYREEAEEHGWPDRRPEYDGEPFKLGWDEERQRGIGVGRWIFDTEAADEETYERWKTGLEHGWDYFGPFGFNRAITGDIDERATAEKLIDSGVAIAGDPDHIFDKICELKESTGTEDLNLLIFFEVGGLDGEEIDTQLEAFGTKVMPRLQEQYPSESTASAMD